MFGWVCISDKWPQPFFHLHNVQRLLPLLFMETHAAWQYQVWKHGIFWLVSSTHLKAIRSSYYQPAMIIRHYCDTILYNMINGQTVYPPFYSHTMICIVSEKSQHKNKCHKSNPWYAIEQIVNLAAVCFCCMNQNCWDYQPAPKLAQNLWACSANCICWHET